MTRVVPGKAVDFVDPGLRERRRQRWGMLVIGLVLFDFIGDAWIASTNADRVEARVRVGMTMAEAVMAAEPYGRNMRGCDAAQAAECTELRFYVGSHSGRVTYRILVRLDRGKVTSVSRSGPRWFSDAW